MAAVEVGSPLTLHRRLPPSSPRISLLEGVFWASCWSGLKYEELPSKVIANEGQASANRHPSVLPAQGDRSGKSVLHGLLEAPQRVPAPAAQSGDLLVLPPVPTPPSQTHLALPLLPPRLTSLCLSSLPDSPRSASPPFQTHLAPYHTPGAPANKQREPEPWPQGQLWRETKLRHLLLILKHLKTL